MSSLKSARHYAWMIVEHMKKLPDKYVDDPKAVQKALELSDEAFKLGVDFLVEREIIKLEAAQEAEDETIESKEVTAEVEAEVEDETVASKPALVEGESEMIDDWGESEAAAV